ncbi:MAG: hypothetical protein HQL29_04280 [Candidatus Omnitrophica bacterium]|nr:hypothetical protein [Candidatus Omnitrophota bacterium]
MKKIRSSDRMQSACVFFMAILLFSPLYPAVSQPSDLSMENENSSGEDAAITEMPDSKNITMDLRGIDITQFLKVLSKKMGKNIVPTKNVSGKINMTLNNMDCREALDLVMDTQGLAYEEKNDNLIVIMREDEYLTNNGRKFRETREIEQLKVQYAQPKMVFNTLNNLKSKIGEIIADEASGTIILIDTPQRLEVMRKTFDEIDLPPIVEIFELQYAEVDDIASVISEMVTQGPGQVIPDERTNSIIVTDLAGNMKNIRQAVNMLDRETMQVYIEAEIVQVTLSDQFNWGINWTKLMDKYSIANSKLEGTFTSKGTSKTNTSDIFKITFDGAYDWSAIITMLSDIGDVKILSSPRIAAINKEEASILVGRKQPYVTATTSQSGESTITSDSVEFIDIGLKLTVVPTINRDGYITMKIKPEISSSTENLETGKADEPRSIIPIVTTSQAETTVKVRDNTTIMIAGLRESTNVKDVSGVPYLSQIPLLGNLFSSKEKLDKQTEIVIFLTPRIMTGAAPRDWDRQELSPGLFTHNIIKEKIQTNMAKKAGSDFNDSKLKIRDGN